MPTMGDFEYIESNVIEITFGSSNSFRGKSILGFWATNNQSTRLHSIMTSEDGISWQELPSSQAGQIVAANIQNTGYFFVKSKPYKDFFSIDVNGCEYTSPIDELLKISIPDRATLESQLYELTVVYPDPVILRAAFKHQSQYQENLQALTPIVYINDMEGKEVKFNRNVIVTLPLRNQQSKKIDVIEMKTWVFENNVIGDRWRDITSDVQFYRHHDHLSFMVNHFSGYQALVASVAISSLAVTTAANNYAEKSRTGEYLVKFLLLQSQFAKTSLLLDCVESENRRAKSKEWANEGFTKPETGTPHYTRDVDVVPGKIINIMVNRPFVVIGGACKHIKCLRRHDNHCAMMVKLHEATSAEDQSTGTVVFEHDDTGEPILYFGIKWLYKRESINTRQQSEDTKYWNDVKVIYVPHGGC
ncbi:uncharacterized protein [Ptychodera flava]|uniref:uncharacterized protein n=1 Tax=Ptychodera flava TaxID=63121 RepID=UPI00396A8F23